MSNKTTRRIPPTYAKNGVYTLEVLLIRGPVLEEFAKENPVVSRRLAIRGEMTLDDLHGAINDSHNRDDDHLYEFQFGKKPMEQGSRRFAVRIGDYGQFWKDEAKSTNIRLDQLDLAVGQDFFYWFDFGDDWWHKITVLEFDPKAVGTQRPKVLQSIGASPPQYPDFDDEGDEDDLLDNEEFDNDEFEDDEDDEDIEPEESSKSIQKDGQCDPSAPR